MTEQEKLDKIRELAEKHWAYTSQVIELAAGHKPEELDHYLYVESGVHFAKHILEMEACHD